MFRRLGLALSFVAVFVGQALALTPGQRLVVLGNHYKPAFQYQFAGAANLPSWITYSGASLATMYDSTGKLTYKPNNIQDQTYFASGWATLTGSVTATTGQTDPVGGTNAVQLVSNGTAQWGYNNALTTQAGTTYLFSVWLKASSPTSYEVTVYNGTFYSHTFSVTTSWQQFFYTFTPNTSANGRSQLVTVNDTNLTVLAYFPTISAVTYETSPRSADLVANGASQYYGPRFDYNPSTLAPNGLLIEEARTNLLISSNLFSDAVNWAKFNITFTAAATTSPDGTSNGWKVLPASGTWTPGSNQGMFDQAPSGFTTQPRTASIFVKYAGAGNYPYFAVFTHSNVTTDGAWFNIQNGTIGTLGTGVTASIQNVGNGWYRLSVSQTTANQLFASFYPCNADGENTYTGDGVKFVYAAFAQAETASFPTSYIPTAASSVARSADAVSLSGPAIGIVSAPQYTAIIQSGPGIEGINSGPNGLFSTTGGLNGIQYSTTTAVTVYNGHSLSATLGSGNALTGQVRVGLAGYATGRALVANGGTVATDANPTTSVNGGYIGSYNNTYFWDGWIASIALYNSRLPNSILQQKSIVGAPY